MIVFNYLYVNVRFLIDKITALFSFTVGLISLGVFFFRYDYIKEEKFFSRFHWLLISFILSILILIYSNSLVAVIVGWDGLGLTSYLLVVFYGSSKSYNAGMLTALTNRGGDFGLIFYIGAIVRSQSLNIKILSLRSYLTSLTLFLLVITSFTKSAQVPFRAWLPAAMAAPTPVSSLVHSSTLVTAGVYLMVRHLSNFTYRPEYWIQLVLFSGTITILIARISAINEKDIKKMVALSTLSQLGIMFISLGLGWSLMAFTHLVIHAFFKAILFISTGNFIHFRENYQRIKKTGGLIYSSPFNTALVILTTFCIRGAPFAAAFFSKEPIVELLATNSFNFTTLVVILFGVRLTVAYSIRFGQSVMSSIGKGSQLIHVEELSLNSLKGTSVLVLPAFITGRLVSSLINLEPAIIHYTSTIKLGVNLLILLPLLGLIYTKMNFFKKFSFTITSIWGLPTFSSRLWNKQFFLYRKLASYCSRFSINLALLNLRALTTTLPYYGRGGSDKVYYLLGPIIAIGFLLTMWS